MSRPDWAKRLIQAREKKGYSQRDLVKLMRINHTTLVHYETGERLPRMDFLKNLIDLTGVDGHWLLTGEEDLVEGSKRLIHGSTTERIKSAFPGIPVDDTLIEVLTALADPVLTKFLRHSFAISLQMAEFQHPDLFKKSKEQG